MGGGGFGVVAGEVGNWCGGFGGWVDGWMDGGDLWEVGFGFIVGGVDGSCSHARIRESRRSYALLRNLTICYGYGASDSVAS